MMRRLMALCLALACLLAPATSRAVINDVDQADDVCAPDADPGVIDQTIFTLPNAVLDFGTRALQITGSGLIDADIYNVTVLAGSITVSVSGVGIKVRGAGNAFSEGGVGRFVARRRCSGDSGLICRTDSTCAAAGAGTCSVGDGDFVLDGRINGVADDPASVIIEAAGDIWIKRSIQTNATYLDSDGGDIELDAVGSVTLDAQLQSTAGSDGTGGDICVLAGGDINVNAAIDADGGDFDGGVVELDAGGDLVVVQSITADAVSGEGFGGEIDLSAGNDIKLIGGGALSRQLLSTTGKRSGEAYGGDGGPQCLFAGRDIVAGQFVRAVLNGASPDGYGEAFEMEALRDIDFQADVVSIALGQYGAGGDFSMYADNDAVVGSTASVNLVGSEGGGGEADLEVGHNLTFAGSIDVSASAGGPTGTVTFDVGRDVTMAGAIVANGAAEAGLLSDVDLSACRMTFTSGASVDNDSPGGRITLSVGTQLEVDAGAELLATNGGETAIVQHPAAEAPIINGVIDPEPTITTSNLAPACSCGNGVVDPLESCDDGNQAPGDGCDQNCQDEGCVAQTPGYPFKPLCSDDNPCTDDGCAGSTDGTGTCGHVDNTAPCDDGLYCTAVDTCSAGTCVGAGDTCAGRGECATTCDEADDVCTAPFGTPCASDGNPCTDDICDGAGKCAAFANTGPCDDGLFCTVTDVCDAGQCVGSGDPCAGGSQCEATCDESADACLDPAGVACDDGDPCTVEDQCDGTGTCSGTAMDCSSLDGNCIVGVCDSGSGACVAQTAADDTPCDDGDECTSNDACTSGECSGTAVAACSCGDGVVEPPEQCDDGDSVYHNGDFCRGDCTLVGCGDPVDQGRATASAALFILKAAVGAVTCAPCVCSVDGNQGISAVDSLTVLKRAVGQPISLQCPSCPASAAVSR